MQQNWMFAIWGAMIGVELLLSSSQTIATPLATSKSLKAHPSAHDAVDASSLDRSPLQMPVALPVAQRSDAAPPESTSPNGTPSEINSPDATPPDGNSPNATPLNTTPVLPINEPSFLPAPAPIPLPDQGSPLENLEPAPETAAPEAPIPETIPETVQIQVNDIQVIGSTIFSQQDFAAVVEPYEGRLLTLEELRQVADAVTQLYLNQGYLTSRAILVDQEITQGVVQIRVVEGSLEQIEVEGARRVNPNYIRSRVALGGRTPVNQGRIEDQLRLLRLDPLFENVEASLRPGQSLGQSILVVRVSETDPWIASLGVDNYSPPSVGSERTTGLIGYRNLTGLGDQILASYARSTTGGADVFDFSYQILLNPMNGTLQLRAAPSSYRITDPKFEPLDIEGDTEFYEVSFRQPLIRTPREEFALSLGFTYEDGRTLISSTLSDSTTTSVIRFGQDYVRRDPAGAWAFQSQFNWGTGLFDATQSGTPDGQFLSWLGQAQRVQILNSDHLLIAQFDVQLTAEPLLSSQQFVMGGGLSVRGYEQNIRLGDNGFRLSIEDRIALLRREDGTPFLQIAPFADMGAVWNAADNPNTLPDQTFLAGIGLGILWEPLPDLNLRVDFTLPLVDLDDRGNNIQDDGIYFSVNWQL